MKSLAAAWLRASAASSSRSWLVRNCPVRSTSLSSAPRVEAASWASAIEFVASVSRSRSDSRMLLTPSWPRFSSPSMLWL